MSEAPKPHVYEPTTADGHCAECGHNIVASWHYVTGADAALRQVELEGLLTHWQTRYATLETKWDALRQRETKNEAEFEILHTEIDALNIVVAALRERHAEELDQLGNEHAECVNEMIKSVVEMERQRHAEAVEQAFREGDTEAWLASEARAALEADHDDG
jgi:hypothetical protein